MEESHALPGTVIEALVFLAATSLVVPAVRRLGLSAVMGFLLIGVALGPHGLSRFSETVPFLSVISFSDTSEVQLLGELGVVFLLFVIGLEVSSSRLWAMRRLVFGLGTAQLVSCAVLIALVVWWAGQRISTSVVIGAALALSSTAVVLQILEERRRMSGAMGRTSFAILLLQDIAVVPLLFLVAALTAGEAVFDPTRAGAALVAAAAAIGGIVLAGRFVLQPLLRWTALAGGREVFVASTLLIVVGASTAAAAAGLSMALGAFLAGLLLAETEYRHEIEIDVEPFKGLLLGLFFVTVGIQIDIGLLLATPLLVFISIAGLLAAKTAIIIPLVKLFGLDWRRAIEAGFLLAPAGEFAFVIIAQASGGGLLPKPAADHLLLVVALSIFVTPLMATAGSWLAQLGRGEPDIEPQHESAAQEGHVVIAGFGRVGRMLASLLDAQGFNYVALDADADRVRTLRKAGWRVHFGDANRKEMLAAVGCGRASAIAVTMDSAQAVERVVAEVHRSWPGVPIFARARDGDQALRLLQIGARKVTPEAVEAALQLGEALLNQLGVPDEAARRIVNDAREAETFRIVDGSSRSV